MSDRGDNRQRTLADLVAPHRTERRNEISQISIKLKRTYFGSAVDADLKEAFDDLEDALWEVDEALKSGVPKDVVGRLREGCGFGLFGNSGVGKSRALERLFLNRPEFEGFRMEGADCLLLSIKAPQPCTLKVLGERLLKEMGYPIRSGLREAAVWQVVMTQLRTRGIRYVHLDELQHVFLNKGGEEVDKVRGTLKTIMQETFPPVGLIVSGTMNARELVQFETQNSRRSQTVVIHPLEFEADAPRLRSMLKGFCSDAGGLALSEEVRSDNFLKRLIHGSTGAYGIACDFTHDAIKLALKEDAPELEVAHYGRVWFKRIACRPDENVFHVDNWASIDARTLLRIMPAPDQSGRRRPNVKVERSEE